MQKSFFVFFKVIPAGYINDENIVWLLQISNVLEKHFYKAIYCHENTKNNSFSPFISNILLF